MPAKGLLILERLMNLLKVVISVLCIFACTSFAEDVSFFVGGIDYWHEAARDNTGQAVCDRVAPMQSASENLTPMRFDWQRALDPSNDEFFREGDYVPPAPFMEVARDPSDSNIQHWHAYIAKKNALAARLEQRLHEYAVRYGQDVVQVPTSPLKRTQSMIPDRSRYQFRMYFDSQCPHCQKMLQTMTELTHQGYRVEAKQVDDLPFDSRALPFPWSKASREEVKLQAISSVPLLLVADSQRQVVYKMSGYKSVSGIFEEIAKSQR